MPASVAGKDLAGRLWAPGSLGVRMNRWGVLQQRRHHAPALLDAVLAREALAVADERGVQKHFIGRRALAALLRELHVEVDLLGLDLLVALGVDQEANTGRRIHLDDELARLGGSRPVREAQPGRPSEYDTKLGLRDRQALAGTEEE